MATPDNLTEEAFETLYAVPALTVSHAHTCRNLCWPDTTG